MQTALYDSQLNSLEQINKGKVRDIYAIDDEHLLIVTTDRLSAFDVVLPDPIPGKGAVLTGLSHFWFDWLGNTIPNHLANVSLTLEEVLPDAEERAQVEGRAMIVQRLKSLPVEAIVRGYITGSGWKDYQKTGMICGNPLPDDLVHAQVLPEPIFTPSTKAEVGEHDENISFDETVKLLGTDLANQIKYASLSIYKKGHDYAKQRGIIMADTKFEFACGANGRLVLID
ncbi:MAG: phosphoribosylaminoimidazolesuccinocarboxamide synthase, partial [Pseudomonadota bacterium]